MMDPTARGDLVASYVRRWYEANRESWWARHRPQFFSYRDNSGTVADSFALALVQAVRDAERAPDFKYCDGCDMYECDPFRGCAYPRA